MASAVHLQLAAPTKTLPVRPARLYEPKLDGCRVLLGNAGAACQVRTRGGHLIQAGLPEVVDALEDLTAEHVLLDGELVVLDENGRCDFDAACARLKSPSGPGVTVFVFDLLALENEDLRGRPLRAGVGARGRLVYRVARGPSAPRPSPPPGVRHDHNPGEVMAPSTAQRVGSGPLAQLRKGVAQWSAGDLNQTLGRPVQEDRA